MTAISPNPTVNGSAGMDGVPVLPADATITSGISADEIALYDRQIRLWGIDAQEQIRNARILIVAMKALGNEIAKNLVLAGVGSLAISDNGIVTEDDLGAQFFLTEEDIGKPRAEAALPRIQKLNNRVNVSILPAETLLKPDSSPDLAAYTMIIATDLSIAQLYALNAASRMAARPFYAGGNHGLYGFVFADLLQQHTFAISRAPSNNPVQPGTAETPTRTVLSTTLTRPGGPGSAPVELVTKSEKYEPFILANSAPLPPSVGRNIRKLRAVPQLLPCFRALWQFEGLHSGRSPNVSVHAEIEEWTKIATDKTNELQLPPGHLKSEFLRSFLDNIYLELAPTSAFLGAALAQDVINVLGKKEQPLQNTLLFDGDEGKAEVVALYPIVTTGDVSL